MAPLRSLASLARRGRCGLSVVLAGVVVAACGSTSSSTTSPAASSAATSPARSSAPASATAKAVTDYAQYVGGSGPANPKLRPVTIGFINQQGGPPSENFPQATAAATAVVKMINAELGGVHGHPLKLEECFIASSQAEGLACGQRMAANKSLDAIVYGLVSIGNSSIYNALKGSIPVIIGVSPSPADDTAKNVFELEGSSTSATGAYGTFIKQAFPSAKTVAIAYQNQPGTAAISEGERATFEKVGLTVKMLPYAPTTSDLIGPVTQMEQADVAAPACGFVDCPLVAKAIKQISGDKPAISTPLWTYLPPPAYPGGDLPHWIVGEAASNLAYTGDPAVVAFRRKSAKYGLPAADTLNVFASFAWTNILVADKVMNEIPYPKLSPSAVTAKLRAFKGGIPLGPPDIDCSGTVDPSAPAVCNDKSQFFEYEGHGQWKQMAGWTAPPS